MSPGICPNPVAQHNDPLERTQAKAQTYLWSRWGQSSPENIHTQSPEKSPCSCLCCGRDQRGRRAPLQNPDGSRKGRCFLLLTASPHNQIPHLGHQLKLVSKNNSKRVLSPCWSREERKSPFSLSCLQPHSRYLGARVIASQTHCLPC